MICDHWSRVECGCLHFDSRLSPREELTPRTAPIFRISHLAQPIIGGDNQKLEATREPWPTTRQSEPYVMVQLVRSGTFVAFTRRIKGQQSLEVPFKPIFCVAQTTCKPRRRFTYRSAGQIYYTFLYVCIYIHIYLYRLRELKPARSQGMPADSRLSSGYYSRVLGVLQNKINPKIKVRLVLFPGQFQKSI